MIHFKNKVAIVTGGASGIGRALCADLSKRGSKVVIADIDTKKAQQVASAINRTGGRAYATSLDVSQAEDVQGLIDKTASEHGRLDYMFNNAGIAIGGEVRGMNLDHWRRILEINLLGVIYGTTAAYSLMTKQRFGHIVNIASLAGLVGFPIAAPYAATKHAVVGLSTSLRAEAADLGVKVTVVCPGFIKTGIFEAATVLNARQEEIPARIPFKMMGAKQAARVILRGVSRNKAIIIFPFHARLVWWLYRLQPALLTRYNRKIVRDFRDFFEKRGNFS